MMYSVNIHTKEHLLDNGAMGSTFYNWESVDANADGWIAWNGEGECPLPRGHMCQYLFANVNDPATSGIDDKYPEEMRWNHVGSFGDIVAYRPIFDEKDHMKSSQADPHPKDVKDMLSTWHDTGALADDSVKVLKALEQYRAMLDACFHLPGCDIIVSGIIHEIRSLERIVESRGYQKEN